MKLTPQLMKAIGDTLTAELTREGLDVQKITLMGEDLGLMITVRVMPGVDLKALCVNGTILWKELIASFMRDARKWNDLHASELIVFRPHVLES
jgi:hypothetical protein